MASRFKMRPRIVVSSVVFFIFLSMSCAEERTRCFWCGPLAEQVHRSQRAPSCDIFDLEPRETLCDQGYTHCAIVAAAPPYAESRVCVKFYQDECYSLYCNSTKTWRMVCACRGDLCNGPSTARETQAFALLPKFTKTKPRKRNFVSHFISVKTRTPTDEDDETVIIISKENDTVYSIQSDQPNENTSNLYTPTPKNVEDNLIIIHGNLKNDVKNDENKNHSVEPTEPTAGDKHLESAKTNKEYGDVEVSKHVNKSEIDHLGNAEIGKHINNSKAENNLDNADLGNHLDNAEENKSFSNTVDKHLDNAEIGEHFNNSKADRYNGNAEIGKCCNNSEADKHVGKAEIGKHIDNAVENQNFSIAVDKHLDNPEIGKHIDNAEAIKNHSNAMNKHFDNVDKRKHLNNTEADKRVGDAEIGKHIDNAEENKNFSSGDGVVDKHLDNVEIDKHLNDSEADKHLGNAKVDKHLGKSEAGKLANAEIDNPTTAVFKIVNESDVTTVTTTTSMKSIGVQNSAPTGKIPPAEALQQNVTPTRVMEVTTMETVVMSTENHVIETTLPIETNNPKKKNSGARNLTYRIIFLISFLVHYCI